VSAEYVVTFAAEKSDVPPTIRLRRLLKLAGRYMGLRAVDVRESRPSAFGNGRTILVNESNLCESELRAARARSEPPAESGRESRQ
jgi:hypothetical protein